MQVQGKRTYAGTVHSTAYHHFTGKECLDVHLLKPARLDVPPGQPNVVCADDMQPAPSWLEYLYQKSHPILRWLPTKLAAWISDNHGLELGIPPKSGLEWTAGELDVILNNNLVPATAAKDSFGHSAAFSGSVSSTAEGQRHDAIHSTWQATTFEERTVRYRCFI